MRDGDLHMQTMTLFGQATGDEPAGGAAIGEAIGATAGALVVTAAIAVLIAGHRSGRIKLLGRAATFSERMTGLPGWAALPSLIIGISLLTAVLGMYWDISLHIDNGRDDGPLANPAHYLILVGLYGALLAGVISAALSTERPSDTAVRFGPGWWIPAGGMLIAACGAFALSGFPLDDFWHRIFGQDVTLWGPTHLMLIGGGSLAVLGAMALMSEAIGGLCRDPQREGHSRFVFVLLPSRLVGGFLAIMVGGVWDQTLPHFPLYLVEALLVEAVSARAGGRSPVATGAIAGVFLGTIGVAAEWGWSHVWMPVPWQATLLPEALVAGLVTAVAAGAVGGFVGAALMRPTPERLAPMGRTAHRAALGAFLVLVAVIGWGLPISDDGPRQATVALEDVRSGAERSVDATVRIDPPDAAEDPNFLNVTAWQGGGSVVSELERAGPGVYRTTEPVPVYGGWKAMGRLHTGDSLVGVPIFLPEDRAIPAPEVPAESRFTRDFVRDVVLLQREKKDDVPAALSTVAYLLVATIAAAMIGLIAWVLLRLERAGGPGPRAPRGVGRRRVREPELVQ